MDLLRRCVSQLRGLRIRNWLSGTDRRVQRKSTFRPTLESLERRELLSATGLEPASMLSIAAQPAEMSAAAGSTARATMSGTVLYSQDNGGFTPDQIRHAYGFDRIYFNNGTIRGDGSGQTIAIIEAGTDPNIESDASQFNARYNLPQFNSPGGPSLQIATLTDNSTGITSEFDPTGDNEGETALDVEWAHAIAPGANILLVYAPVQLFIQTDSRGHQSITWKDSTPIYEAAQWAAQQNGVSVVSMSLGGENQGEAANDSYFLTPQGHNGVTFVASSGDAGYFSYPASCPYVLGVGGTNLTLDGSGNYGGETVWNDRVGSSGGGVDPTYQNPYYPNYQKNGPDVTYNAVDFSVYDSYANGWTSFYGTSAGAPQWAALLAIANQGRALNGEGTLDGATQTLPKLYQMTGSAFHSDISGSNSDGVSGAAAIGLGSPYADRVVSLLSDQPISTPPAGSPPPSAAPDPMSELAADALMLAQSYQSFNLNGIYAALMDFESLLFSAPAAEQMGLEQAFLNDVFADL